MLALSTIAASPKAGASSAHSKRFARFAYGCLARWPLSLCGETRTSDFGIRISALIHGLWFIPVPLSAPLFFMGKNVGPPRAAGLRPGLGATGSDGLVAGLRMGDRADWVCSGSGFFTVNPSVTGPADLFQAGGWELAPPALLAWLTLAGFWSGRLGAGWACLRRALPAFSAAPLTLSLPVEGFPSARSLTTRGRTPCPSSEGRSLLGWARLSEGGSSRAGSEGSAAKPSPSATAPQPTVVQRRRTVLISVSRRLSFRLGFIVTTAQKYHFQRRHDDEQHEGADQHAAYDHGGQRTLDLTANASGNRRRKQPDARG